MPKHPYMSISGRTEIEKIAARPRSNGPVEHEWTSARTPRESDMTESGALVE